MWNAVQEVLGRVVTFFYEVIPNLGVAIIFLTVAVGVALFPLTLKQTRSMKAMSELHPELKRLQKELAGDKQALQQATMALYKERKVNPAAGCLPLLLQMPIWFALFSVLRSFAQEAVDAATRFALPETSSLARDIETIGTGFGAVWKDFLWMDLGTTPRVAFDIGLRTSVPYLITIVIVMATAWYQQVQTTARSKDGKQQPPQPGQAIMKIFPVFFGFISFTLPAGLVVYFAASQIFRIGQQSLILWLDRKRVPVGGEATKAPTVDIVKEEPRVKPPGPVGGTAKSRTGGSRSTQARSPQISPKRRGKKRKRR